MGSKVDSNLIVFLKKTVNNGPKSVFSRLSMIVNKSISIGLLIVFIILFAGGLTIKMVFFRQYIRNVVLIENVVIAPEWKEVGTPDLLKVEKDNQYISLLLESPFEDDTRAGGIKAPDGTIIKPEIRLVDDEGREYSLHYGGARRFEDGVFVNYRYEANLPPDKHFAKVIIRSAASIPLRQILWSGYNTKDLP
jgi:hypothetical protein